MKKQGLWKLWKFRFWCRWRRASRFR